SARGQDPDVVLGAGGKELGVAPHLERGRVPGLDRRLVSGASGGRECGDVEPAADQGLSKDVEPMKCVILAGGKGTRLSEETQVRPKPMVEIGVQPILWHIMKLYAAFGITEFIVCLGYK